MLYSNISKNASSQNPRNWILPSSPDRIGSRRVGVREGKKAKRSADHKIGREQVWAEEYTHNQFYWQLAMWATDVLAWFKEPEILLARRSTRTRARPQQTWRAKLHFRKWEKGANTYWLPALHRALSLSRIQKHTRSSQYGSLGNRWKVKQSLIIYHNNRRDNTKQYMIDSLFRWFSRQ